MKSVTIIVFFLLIGVVMSGQTPFNWTVDEINPNEDLSLYPDPSVFTDGLKSCRLELNSGAVPYLISESYTVTPGATYQFSIDVFDNDTAGQLKVFADFYDIYGFNIYGHSPLFSSDSTEWQTLSWEDTVPEQAVTGYVLIKFYCEPDLYHFTRKALAWVDHVQFRQAGGENLVANGSFEEWVVSVEEPGHDNAPLAMYPNPADQFVNIDLKSGSGKIVVTDIYGREMIRVGTKETGRQQIDISRLTNGMYIISAYQEDNRIYKGKLLVSR